MNHLSRQQLEAEIILTRHILETVRMARQLAGNPTNSYMGNFLREMGDRAATQESLLREILKRSDDFEEIRGDRN